MARRLFGVCAAIAFAVVGVSLWADSNPVKIGVLYELSGPLAAAGTKTCHGVELAADVVNNVYPGLPLTIAQWEGIPSLGNAKIELVIKDTRADPSLAADLAKQLILDEKVVALIGCRLSSVTKTASAVAERYGVPFVCAAATSRALTERGYKWFWRTSPNDYTLTQDLFALLKGLTEGKVRGVPPIPKEEIDEVAVAAENTEWGSACFEHILELAAKEGYNVVQALKYPHTAPDLTSEIQKLLAPNPEVMLFVPYLSDAILIVETLNTFKAHPKLIWGQDSGFMFSAFYDAVGNLSNGILTRTIFTPGFAKTKSVAQAVNALFKERYGEDFGGASARAFTGMQALAMAINAAGSTKPEALKEALNALYVPPEELVVPFDGIRFNEKGQNILARGLIAQWQNGQLEIIYPFEFATADMIYPFPGY